MPFFLQEKGGQKSNFLSCQKRVNKFLECCCRSQLSKKFCPLYAISILVVLFSLWLQITVWKRRSKETSFGLTKTLMKKSFNSRTSGPRVYLTFHGFVWGLWGRITQPCGSPYSMTSKTLNNTGKCQTHLSQTRPLFWDCITRLQVITND